MTTITPADFEGILSFDTDYMEDTFLDLRAVVEITQNLSLDLRASKSKLLDASFDLRTTDGIKLTDAVCDLRATTGQVFRNVAMDLRAINQPPEFKSYVAQRISSVISDTGV